MYTYLITSAIILSSCSSLHGAISAADNLDPTESITKLLFSSSNVRVCVGVCWRVCMLSQIVPLQIINADISIHELVIYVCHPNIFGHPGRVAG